MLEPGRAGDGATRTLWERAIDAAGVGSFEWDLSTGRLVWDERLLALFGYDRSDLTDSIEAFRVRLHPDDLDRATTALRAAIASCGEYEAEYRIVLPTGQVRWIRARGRALIGPDGSASRLLGAAYDTTAVHDSDARVARVLESMSAAFVLVDPTWRFRYVNRQAERVLGRSRDQLLGRDIWALFPEMRSTTLEHEYRLAMTAGRPTTFEAYYPAPLDAWFEVRALPGPDGLSMYFLDVTQRHVAEQEARRTAERAALLAEVTSEITRTLDTEEAVARLARLVVPALGDWCVVTLVEDDPPTVSPWQRLRDVGWWHADPARRPIVERYVATRLDALTERSFLAAALRSGGPVVVDEDTTRRVAAVLQPGEARDLIRRLAPEYAVAVPLTANGRTLGLLTICRGHRSAASAPTDLTTAVEVSQRAALALDNLRLYQQQRRLAEGLQRSLLTAPPAPDHVQVSVRYEPAAETAQVGGDWYDAFLQTQGTTMLVIGDVVGHDAEAAAAMGQVRGLLRGIAATTGERPAAVLTRLDAAMELLRVGTTATAVVARLEQTADELERGICRFRWSNAGHPPPMAMHPDGTVTVLSAMAGIDSDLLLGIDPETTRTESEVTLDHDTTVLLYTDGLVERRGQSLDEGLAKLRHLLGGLATEDLEPMCDAVLAGMLDDELEDDVALAAVRLHRQDRPRPATAGAVRIPPGLPPYPQDTAGPA